MSIRMREQNAARENKERNLRTTRIAQSGLAARVVRKMEGVQKLQKLEKELEALAERKRQLFEELKRSMDAPPPTPLPKPFQEVRRNLKAGKPLTPPTPVDTNADADANKRR